MPVLSLALRSLANRAGTVGLTIMSIAISVALLIGVEKIRTSAKDSFANTVSGTDLIVGARGGAVPLLLYSVFRIGNATNNVSWQSYRHFAAHPRVRWTIPMSLGDSHRGFRVLGTNQSYFEHFRYGEKQRLRLHDGERFDDLFDTVIGAAVAEELGYVVGQQIVIDHGIGSIGFNRHEDKPFRVSGILAPTGTPVDRTVHVSLQAIEAIHADWRDGRKLPGRSISADQVRQLNLQPKTITAFFIGLDSRFATFGVQREINDYAREPMLAILPGVTLHELWGLMDTAETALLAMSICVVIAGLTGMIAMLFAGLNERRREMAVLRAVGARPAHIFGLLVTEAVALTIAGILAGLALMYTSLLVAQPLISSRYGLHLSVSGLSPHDVMLLGLVFLAGLLSGAFPAWQAYRRSLADGMSLRL